MIEVKKDDGFQLDRSSSKGNQMKWHKDDFWYKADYCGYEGLSEYAISNLLLKSSLKKDEYVLYDLETIKYDEAVFCGCRSKNFLMEGETLITIERLFEQVSGKKNLRQNLFKDKTIKQRIKDLVDFVELHTGIKNFGIHLAKLITIDAIFLNEDRHFNNIAVIKKIDGTFRLCPIFDSGAGLLSDTTIDYPLTGDTYRLIDKVKPKTFSYDSFLEQLEAIESLYGETILFNFSGKDIVDVLKKPDVNIYSKEVIDRIYTVLTNQRNIYKYLFD